LTTPTARAIELGFRHGGIPTEHAGRLRDRPVRLKSTPTVDRLSRWHVATRPPVSRIDYLEKGRLQGRAPGRPACDDFGVVRIDVAKLEDGQA
jgi:hypothetical protein